MWLHSSVNRASHRYSRRSRVRILLKPWFFQASSFQLLKLEFTAMIFFTLMQISGPVFYSRSCWTYLYSNMSPRRSGQIPIFGVVLFVSKCLWELRNKRNFSPESRGAMLEYWYIERCIFSLDLTFSVLFHRFQKISHRIKTDLSVATVVSFAAVIRVVEALRDDPNNGCEGDYRDWN